MITSRTEGTATYTALLFVPGQTPYDYYTKEYEKGLALYASGVMIMEKCATCCRITSALSRALWTART